MTARTTTAQPQLSRTLAALADPTRRQLVQLLGNGPKPVNALLAEFSLSGPAISKHLRVLRHSLLVEEVQHDADARLRIYRLRREPFNDLQAWVQHMQAFWELQLGAFAAHVSARAGADETARRSRGKAPASKRKR